MIVLVMPDQCLWLGKVLKCFQPPGHKTPFCGECDEHMHGSMASWVYTDNVCAMFTGPQGRQCLCIDLVKVYSVSV